MRKEIALITLVSLMVSGCGSSAATTTPDIKEIGVGNANTSIQRLINFNFDETDYISDDTRDKVKSMYDKYLADSSKEVELDITDDMSEFILYCQGMVSDLYAKSIGLNDDMTVSAEEEASNEMDAANNTYTSDYTDDILTINKNIKELVSLKQQNYTRFLHLLYSTCELYRSLPEQFRSMLYNVDVLGVEVEQVGGSLETNFNLESNLFYYETAIRGDYTSEYTGKTDEELGVVQGHEYTSDADHGDLDFDEDGNEIGSYTEETGEPVIEETISEENTLDNSTGETSESVEMTESVESTPVSSIGDNIEDSELQGWIDCISLTDENGLNIDSKKLLEHICSLSDKLTLKDDRIILTVTGSEEIKLADGYSINVTRDTTDDWQLDVEDYFYWDDGTFNINVVNRGLSSAEDITLSGAIVGGKVDIHNFDDLVADMSPITVEVWSVENDNAED